MTDSDTVAAYLAEHPLTVCPPRFCAPSQAANGTPDLSAPPPSGGMKATIIRHAKIDKDRRENGRLKSLANRIMNGQQRRAKLYAEWEKLGGNTEALTMLAIRYNLCRVSMKKLIGRHRREMRA